MRNLGVNSLFVILQTLQKWARPKTKKSMYEKREVNSVSILLQTLQNELDPKRKKGCMYKNTV